MDSNDKDFLEMPARLDKTLDWLRMSRDAWKEKTKESKTKLKIATLGIKRARESRDKIEKELHNIQKQLDQKDIEISRLKNQLEQMTQEVDTLKKRDSSVYRKAQMAYVLEQSYKSDTQLFA